MDNQLKTEKQKYENKYCNNCGKLGHISKYCDKPMTSYGVILYKKIDKKPYLVMVNRKDSICYIDFVRGKYDINNIENIKKLLSRISKDESDKIKNNTFDKLWGELWNTPIIKVQKEYIRSKELFNKLKKGIEIDNNYYNIETILELVKPYYLETEWEFPKGKKKRNETYYDASLRELEEETNINKNDYSIIRNISPFIEELKGEDNVNYKNIYYIGICNNEENLLINKNNLNQINEIKHVKLMSIEESKDKIRDYNISKIELINKIEEFIEKYDLHFEIKN